jgi:hypothetical protein
VASPLVHYFDNTFQGTLEFGSLQLPGVGNLNVVDSDGQ